MLQVTPNKKQENKLLQILQELANREGVTPAQWIGITIMKEAKEKGLIKATEQSKPSESKQRPAIKLPNGSYDEFATED